MGHIGMNLGGIGRNLFGDHLSQFFRMGSNRIGVAKFHPFPFGIEFSGCDARLQPFVVGIFKRGFGRHVDNNLMFDFFASEFVGT